MAAGIQKHSLISTTGIVAHIHRTDHRVAERATHAAYGWHVGRMDRKLGRDVVLTGRVCLTVAAQIMSELHLPLEHSLIDLLLYNEASLSLVLNKLIVEDTDK